MPFYLAEKSEKTHLTEDHHLVFVLTENEAEARRSAKKKWDADEIHVDGVQKRTRVNGYKILLQKTDE